MAFDVLEKELLPLQALVEGPALGTASVSLEECVLAHRNVIFCHLQVELQVVGLQLYTQSESHQGAVSS